MILPLHQMAITSYHYSTGLYILKKFFIYKKTRHFHIFSGDIDIIILRDYRKKVIVYFTDEEKIYKKITFPKVYTFRLINKILKNYDTIAEEKRNNCKPTRLKHL